MRLLIRTVWMVLLLLSLRNASSAWWGRRRREKQRGGPSDSSIPFVSRDSSATVLRGGEDVAFSSSEQGYSIVEGPVSTLFTATSKRASDLLVQLGVRTGYRGDDSHELRELFSERTASYLDDLQQAAAQSLNDEEEESSSSNKLPDPRKLLHALAPKIPAIKRSPDVALRVHASGADIDCGLAACLIGTLGHVAELYDQVAGSADEDSSVMESIVQDRRFEQLVECVLCGIDMQKVSEEAASAEDTSEELEEPPSDTRGLSIRDSCRAAWGIALLYEAKNGDSSIGDEKVLDILKALSLRIRDTLLTKLQQLKQGDLVVSVASEDALTIDERLDRFSEELAEDAASAMWTFACVKACTGADYSSMFDLCASVLCLDPYETRRQGQKVEMALETMTVGSNDVIERLAESEAEIEGISEEPSEGQQEDSHLEDASPLEKSVELQTNQRLLDWLSPTELTDTLWAAALHGGSDIQTAPNITGTNTTRNMNEYCTTAFERMVTLLHGELQRYQPPELTTNGFVAPENVGDDIKMIGAVYDREEEAVTRDYEGPEEIQLADSTESSPDPNLSNVDATPDTTSVDLAGEEQDTDGSPFEAFDGDSVNVVDELEEGDLQEEVNRHADQIDFTPLLEDFIQLTSADLCSLAWAATELDNPHSGDVAHSVTKLFAYRGRKSVDNLSGGDLSNLAWAIAKHKDTDEAHETKEDLAILVLGWLADNALQRGSSTASSDIMHRFQPPQLSRLLWSLAAVLPETDAMETAKASIETLSYQALLVSGSDLSLFGTEDLARIVWAFLVLNDPTESFSWPYVPESLGRAIATIETCLVQWENGKLSSQKNQTQEVDQHRESNRFSSFFGRSRFYFPFLDLNVGDSFDEADESQSAVLTTKTRLPLLSDLPVDPLTLCKATSVVTKLATDPLINLPMSDTLVRTSMRLLTSRNARLLRECPLSDLVRLLEAVVLSDATRNRELIGFFTRKTLHFVNELPRDDSDLTNFNLKPSMLSTFLWSLGKLGVTYVLLADDRSVAHRKLHLVAKPRLVVRSELANVSIDSAIRLLDGLATTGLAVYDKEYVSHLLQHIDEQSRLVQDEATFCSLVEVLGSLKTALEEDKRVVPSHTNLDGNSTVSPEQLDESTQHANADESQEQKDALAVCNEVLAFIGEASALRLSSFSIAGIRRILHVLVQLPFQCDSFVDAAENEVLNREQQLENEPRLEDTVASASSMLIVVKRMLMDEDDSAEWSLQSSLQALFGRPQSDSPDLPGDAAQPMEREQVIELLSSTTSSLDRLNQALKVSRVSSSNKSSSPETGRFELSRCKEEIGQYRRNDFSEGNRHSRIDERRRRSMTKRVLSRLMPP